MLQLNNLGFDYSDKRLFENIQLNITAGNLLHLQGKNGSGKTTLLKLMAGLLQPTEGDIIFNGQPIQQAMKSYQENICYIGHKPGISIALSPRQNYFFDLHHERCPTDFAQCMNMLSLTGLEDVPCARLSAGQCRRVAFLRLFMTNSRIWLLDEPFTALDGRAITFLKQKLDDHLANQGIVILTSHQSIPFSSEEYLEYVLR